MILWSQKDIQDHYGVSRSTVVNWMKDEGFPNGYRPSCGRVWESFVIEWWVESFRPSIGRPKGS